MTVFEWAGRPLEVPPGVVDEVRARPASARVVLRQFGEGVPPVLDYEALE